MPLSEKDSEKHIKEFQKIYEKKYKKKISREEASDGVNRIAGLAELIFDSYLVDCARKQKLKKHPNGFHLDDGEVYTCRICGDCISNEQTWWDKNGTKCMNCQRALDKKIIPKSVCKRDGSWYAMWEFNYRFKLKTQTVQKLVRQGKLKSRIIPNSEGKTHFEIFLVKDNPGVLPKKPGR